MTQLIDRRETAKFIIESGIGDLPAGADILEMISPHMSTPMHYDKRLTRADAWIASHGDPMKNSDAAIRLFDEFTRHVDKKSDGWDFTIARVGSWHVYDVMGGEMWGQGDTLALAMVAAVLKLAIDEDKVQV